MRRRWVRRFGYLVLFLLWLLVMSFPIGAALLATSGQLEVGSETGHHVRLFLVQERRQQGVGLEWTRSGSADGCRQGRLLYAMWEGRGEDAHYCTCHDAGGSVTYSAPGACPITN